MIKESWIEVCLYTSEHGGYLWLHGTCVVLFLRHLYPYTPIEHLHYVGFMLHGPVALELQAHTWPKIETLEKDIESCNKGKWQSNWSIFWFVNSAWLYSYNNHCTVNLSSGIWKGFE